MILRTRNRFAVLLPIIACLLGIPIMPSFAGQDLVVSVAPFIEALNKSPETFFYTRDALTPEDQRAIPGIVADCLGRMDGVKVAPHDGAAAYKVTVSATSYRKRFFVVAQATDARGVLRGLHADFLDLEELKRKICEVVVHPLAERLLHPRPETPESAASLHLLVDGIGFVNSGFRETAYTKLYRVLMDYPRDADALYWLAKAFATEHPDIARVHAREFMAAFPDDPRRPEIETLLGNLSDRKNH